MKTKDKRGLKGFIPYPFQRIMGVIDTAEDAAAVTEELHDLGLGDDRLELFCCDEGIRRLDLTGQWHGGVAKFVRKVQSFLGDEYGDAQEYDGELKAGHVIVSVRIDNEREKAVVSRVLLDGGARGIRFFGGWMTEKLA